VLRASLFLLSQSREAAKKTIALRLGAFARVFFFILSKKESLPPAGRAGLKES
jgi:hypothetical protein